MDKTLQNAVIRRVGRDSLQDVANHGADSGFPGFTYYADTCGFYARHQSRIVRAEPQTPAEKGQR